MKSWSGSTGEISIHRKKPKINSESENYTTPGLIKTTITLNPKITSKLSTKDKSNHLENSSSKNLEDNLILSTESDMNTNSDADVLVESDTTEPHASRTILDSVTAVLAVQ